MNNLAKGLNERLEGSIAYSMLSDFGKRIYVPRGIVVQGNEAKARANRFNATIGVALEDGQPMYFDSMKKQFNENMSSSEIFGYAPMGGVMALREAWKVEMLEKNPDLEGVKTSMPVVCSGLTNGLSTVFSILLDEGDSVVLPDMYWENYDLLIDEQRKAEKVLYPMFRDGGFNVEGLDKTIDSVKGDKVVVMLNFPNNPSGYTPTANEAQAIADVLKKKADAGRKIAVITDDAYFGLFYEEEIYNQSIFAKVANLSENILAVKCDAATKENMAWGFRVGFITYAFKGATEDQLAVLVEKTLGTIRGSISSCSMAGQSVLLRSLRDTEYKADKQNGFDRMHVRYVALREALEKHKKKTCLKPLPFNSGYFMSLETKCNAEDLRQILLEKYETGIIRMSDHIIRLAFCSVPADAIQELVDTVYKAAEELC